MKTPAFMRHFRRKRVLVPLIVVIIIGFGGIVWAGKSTKPLYDTVLATKSELKEEVSVTGRVKSAASVELAFEKGGRVGKINVKVGDRVKAGQQLGSLDAGELYANYRQSQASLAAAQAKYDELVRGTRKEELDIQVSKTTSAQDAYRTAESDLVSTLVDAYSDVDDAIRNKLDKYYTSPRSYPQITLAFDSSQFGPRFKDKLESGRLSMEGVLNDWKRLLDTATSLQIAMSKKYVAAARDLLDQVSLAANAMTASSYLSQTTIDTIKNDISSARSQVNSAQSSLISAETRFNSAKLTLGVEEGNLALKEAGTDPQELKAEAARLAQAQANLESTAAAVRATTIAAPFAGIVTKVIPEIGEIVSANTIAFGMLSESEFRIEVNVPEADIAKIKVGDKAEVTLDAYGSDVAFSTHVILIDPAETVIENVPTYKITLQFDTKDERIRSGMTANIDIATGTRENALSVPTRSVIDKDGSKIIRVIDPSTSALIEKKVTVGLKGSNGNIEITSGLSEGEKVVTFIKK